jgi:hypothetical protein
MHVFGAFNTLCDKNSIYTAVCNVQSVHVLLHCRSSHASAARKDGDMQQTLLALLGSATPEPHVRASHAAGWCCQLHTIIIQQHNHSHFHPQVHYIKYHSVDYIKYHSVDYITYHSGTPTHFVAWAAQNVWHMLPPIH